MYRGGDSGKDRARVSHELSRRWNDASSTQEADEFYSHEGKTAESAPMEQAQRKVCYFSASRKTHIPKHLVSLAANIAERQIKNRKEK